MGVVPGTRDVNRFLGADVPFEDARIALLGVPFDGTSSFSPGSRFAPAAIRRASDGLETYSFPLKRALDSVRYTDAGDLDLPFGNVQRVMDMVEEAVRALLERGKTPFILGGEHLISLPVVQGVSGCFPGLKVVQLDAHADLRETYMSERLSHATVMYHICRLVTPERVAQIGIRSGTEEEFAYAGTRTQFWPGTVMNAVGPVVDWAGSDPVYLTVDIDIVDPAFAPGTGTPEPGGPGSGEILEAVRYLCQNVHVVGVDLVEVCPQLDTPSQITSFLAAKLTREILLSVG